jgi:hypothetical protein
MNRECVKWNASSGIVVIALTALGVWTGCNRTPAPGPQILLPGGAVVKLYDDIPRELLRFSDDQLCGYVHKIGVVYVSGFITARYPNTNKVLIENARVLPIRERPKGVLEWGYEWKSEEFELKGYSAVHGYLLGIDADSVRSQGSKFATELRLLGPAAKASAACEVGKHVVVRCEPVLLASSKNHPYLVSFSATTQLDSEWAPAHLPKDVTVVDWLATNMVKQP